MMEKVLEGIRVLDFGRFVAAPYCGMILSDMGAEVIRIERPGGEEDRIHGLVGETGRNVNFMCYGRNKRAITLDIFSGENAQSVLADLVKNSDVVLHNFSPDAAIKAGLSYEALNKINPKIILTGVSCYGNSGPYANRVGFDFIAQAMSGCMKLGGYPDNPPIRSFFNPIDYSTALSAAVGTLAAIRHRDMTGEGQEVDVSLLQTAVSYASPFIAEYETFGKKRPMVGNRAAYVGPSDIFECKDGYVFIANITTGLWRRLAKAVGHEEWIDDPDLKTDLQRFNHREKVDPLIAQWTSEKTIDEVLEKLDAARVPCSKVLDVDEVKDHPHIKAAGMLPTVDQGDDEFGEIPVCASPIRMSKSPLKIEKPAPEIGEYNHEMYREVLGYSDTYVQELADRGVI
jgi:crotonobetainyl-CoA:carnitine CoA-transferase CaiB-like acyl-CoA transferase